MCCLAFHRRRACTDGNVLERLKDPEKPILVNQILMIKDEAAHKHIIFCQTVFHILDYLSSYCCHDVGGSAGKNVMSCISWHQNVLTMMSLFANEAQLSF